MEGKRFSPLDLQELLASSRENNASKDITGLLLYKHGNFMQVIEGPREAVSGLFSSIEKDPRHRRVIEVINEEIQHRDFADWSMAFRDLTAQPMPELKGYDRLLEDSPEAIDLSQFSENVRSLLNVFVRATSTP